MLTGYDIDVYRERGGGGRGRWRSSRTRSTSGSSTQLKGIGCDTAKSVLEISPDDLVRRTDLEEETIREVISILKSEFE